MHDAVEHDPGAPGRGNGIARRLGGGRDLVEAPVVTRGHERGEDRRVVATTGEPPRVDGPLDERERLRRHDHRRTGGGVQPAELARGPEAAPLRLERFDRRGRGRREIGGAAEREHRHIGAHGAEPRVRDLLANRLVGHSCDGIRCRRWQALA